MRPLTQYWWPVTLLNALDPTRPNPINLLDKKLVVWQTSSQQWSCLDDFCAHRFAPLSEGRIETRHQDGTGQDDRCISCAYHGWRFDATGSCTHIPQQQQQQSTVDNTSSVSKWPKVQAYPVREAANMLWIWPDTEMLPPPLHDNDYAPPISNLLQRFHDSGATTTGFMRDLPYGMELLGENLLDISHLPFSHHSVGALNRQDGAPVPLVKMSHAEKQQLAARLQNAQGPLPAFQARVVNAAEHDPEIVAALKNPLVQHKADPAAATSCLGFYAPAHVRYHRNPGIPGSSYEINLFMCPTSAGNSRVFLFTPFESRLTSQNEQTKHPKEVMRVPQVENATTFPPVAWIKARIKTLWDQMGGKNKNVFPAHAGHMIAHSIFDGDGIFLHKQGDRMARNNLRYRDYATPTSSDIMVNAYRRWLDLAACMTADDRARRAVVRSDDENQAVYRDTLARSAMLDRYTTHTANCKICQDALNKLDHKRNRLRLASSALVGATGASSAFSFMAVLTVVGTQFCRQSVTRALVAKTACAGFTWSAVTAATAMFGFKKVVAELKSTEREINRFYFEDYVHADKS